MCKDSLICHAPITDFQVVIYIFITRKLFQTENPHLECHREVHIEAGHLDRTQMVSLGQEVHYHLYTVVRGKSKKHFS